MSDADNSIITTYVLFVSIITNLCHKDDDFRTVWSAIPASLRGSFEVRSIPLHLLLCKGVVSIIMAMLMIMALVITMMMLQVFKLPRGLHV